ncbi:MAG: Nif3-like dinuclear metal center hexameric protein [Planctomycetota bacterium]|jgi:putative NIF3 family GTP cyclohydrolase 1 type 2
MKFATLTEMLDHEFSVVKTNEGLVAWSVTEENKPYLNPAFLNRQSGLFLKSAETIEKVCTTVFITDCIAEKIIRQKSNSLIFTHHHFDYHEDHRGLEPISAFNLKRLKNANASIFVAHASLDTHDRYGTSISLAKLLHIEVDELFFDYFGAPTALVGHITKTPFSAFAETVKQKLGRPVLTLEKNHETVEKIAVVAGGGDMPDILQQAKDFDCDTYLAGTIEHRWKNAQVQESNKQFHELNNQLKLNLIGGTHFGTERPAMISVVEYFRNIGIDADYCEDETLLNAR